MSLNTTLKPREQEKAKPKKVNQKERSLLPGVAAYSHGQL
jgi:hypothetical protein